MGDIPLVFTIPQDTHSHNIFAMMRDFHSICWINNTYHKIIFIRQKLPNFGSPVPSTSVCLFFCVLALFVIILACYLQPMRIEIMGYWWLSAFLLARCDVVQKQQLIGRMFDQEEKFKFLIYFIILNFRVKYVTILYNTIICYNMNVKAKTAM